MDPSIIIIVFLVLSIIIAFGIGGNDETFAGVYGAKALSMKQLLIIAAILAILGAIILGESVSKKVGKGILLIDMDNAIIITILVSTAIWLIISSALGLPISTTHATIGAIIGMGVLFGGAGGLDWVSLVEMSMWWILSPIIGFIATYYTYKLINKRVIRKLNGFEDFENAEKKFTILLLIVICVTAFSRAGNDCSNAVGIISSVGTIELSAALIITGLSLAAGIVVIGRVVIKSVGSITELRPSTAFAAQIPTAFILFFGTLLGIPLSGSHMLVASFVGLAMARSAPVDKKGLKKIMAVWLLTFPIAAGLAIVLYFPISLFFV